MPAVFKIHVLKGDAPEEADVEMAHPDPGAEFPCEVFLGFAAGKILDIRGLDEEKDQQQDKEDGAERPQEDTHQPANQRPAMGMFGGTCVHKINKIMTKCRPNPGKVLLMNLLDFFHRNVPYFLHRAGVVAAFSLWDNRLFSGFLFVLKNLYKKWVSC